jgi:molybdenum cofactor guanylyltransferase
VPDPDRPSAAAIVLAGGRSSRFGRDKLAAPYRGRPLLEQTVGRVAAVCDEVVIVIAPGAAAPPVAGARFVHDAREGEGPLAGAVAGLGAVDTELSVLVGGDMPELAPAVLAEMLRSASASGADAVALRDGDRVRPLPCALRTAPALASARELYETGERSLRALVTRLRPEAIDEAVWSALDPSRGTVFDVDEPADLER